MNTASESGTAKSRNPQIYDMIGHKLRDYYEEIAKQPVPDRFLELLAQLESKTASKKHDT